MQPVDKHYVALLQIAQPVPQAVVQADDVLTNKNPDEQAVTVAPFYEQEAAPVGVVAQVA